MIRGMLSLSFTRWQVLALGLLLAWGLGHDCPAASGQGEAPSVHLDGPDPADREAQRLMQDFESELETIQALPIEKRIAKSRRLEGRLEKLLRQVDGTRLANKARYLLAEWRLRFAPDAEIEGLITAIARDEHLHYKNLARLLLVRLRIHQRRIREARAIAESVVDTIPEFHPTIDLLDFHEQAGQGAPLLTARNLTGGSDQPINDRTEPWLLICFVELSVAEQRLWLQTQLEELQDQAYLNTVEPVVVSFDSDPLAALTGLRQLPGGGDTDLLWVSPNEPGLRARWRQRWQLPVLPVSALLGPDRNRMAHDVQIDALRVLVGLPPKGPQRGNDDNPRRGGSKSPFSWKGRR